MNANSPCSSVGRYAIALWVAVCALAVVAFSPRAAEAGERIRVKGTTVSIEPPPGWVAAERFAGFQHEESQGSIVVTVLPAPAPEVRKGFTKDALAKGGMTWISESAPRVNGSEATLIRAEQTANGALYTKWMLVAGTNASTVLIAGNFLSGADAELDAAVKKSVLGATWDGSDPDDVFEALPFRLKAVGELTMIRAMGPTVLLSKPGNAKKAPGDPLYVAGASISATPGIEVVAFSEARVRQVAGVTELSDLRSQTVKVADRDAHEIVASGKDAKSGTALLIYQVIVLRDGGYWLMQGIVSADQGTAFLEEFRKITATVTENTAAGSGAPAKGGDAEPAPSDKAQGTPSTKTPPKKE